MPEFDVFLILLPAKKDLFAVYDGGEVQQTAVQGFKLDFAPLKFQQHVLQVSHRTKPGVDLWSAQISARLDHPAQAFVALPQLFAKVQDAGEPQANVRQQRPRLLTGVVVLKSVVHEPAES